MKGAMKQWQQFFWQWRGVITITPSVAAVVLLLRCIGLLQTWEWAAFDQYTRLRPTEPTDNRVVIVGLDENDLKALNQSQVSDAVLAELLNKLKEQSPRAIGLDLYRDVPVGAGESELADVYRTTPNLIGIRKVVGEVGRETVAPPPVLAELGQIGANDLMVDGDNTVRRGLLNVQDPDGNTVYSLSLYLALLYLDSEGIGPEMVDEDTWWLGKTLFQPFETNSGGYVRADAQGYQQIIRYRGENQFFETVSFMDVLTGQISEDWATDKVVLIGAVGESSNDHFYTPHSSTLLSNAVDMAGVEIHSNLTSQIISAALEGRPLIRSWSEPVEWLWVLSWSAAGALLIWQIDQGGKRTKGQRTKNQIRGQRILWVSSTIALLGGSTFIPFLYGWWIPIVPAFLAAIGSATAVTAYLARSAGDIRRTFGRYLSDEIVTTLLENPEGQKLGGERRNITILTSDLRGFTATSERLPPETVIKVLNFYLGHMADVIGRHSGTIDEFMGDGILVLFGAPIVREDDAKRAVACAVEMQLAMTAVNQTMEEWGLAPLEMGIGIHTGEVVVGNIGSEKRKKYGIVGSPVNLTYRIESFTTGGQILISGETHRAAAPLVTLRGEQQVKPKGVAQPITIYDVLSVGAPYNKALTQEEEHFFSLAEKIPLRLSPLQGKSINQDYLTGWITELSEKGAVLAVKTPTQDNDATIDSTQLKPTTDTKPTTDLKPLTNLKLNFYSQNKAVHKNHDEAISEDIYAKILDIKAYSQDLAMTDSTLSPTQTIGSLEAEQSFYIRFTAKPPAISRQLSELYQTLLASNKAQKPLLDGAGG
ncbi:MAG: adenylate/guanylate cyclase domain-containing protein [Cyanobacteria bacterium J06573_11]